MTMLKNSLRTPLHLAIARASNQDVSRQLIQRGADVCTRNIEGKTPFHAFFRESNRELLAHSHEVIESAIVDDRGMHLLHYAAWSCKSTVTDIQPLLSTNVLDVFAKDHEGRSALFFAAERGNLAVLDHLLLLPDRPDLTDTDINGLSVMHYAVRSRRVQAIDRLYHNGCSIHATDKHKQTVLHHAVKRRNLEAVKRIVLLDGNEMLKSTDNRNRTPLDLARNMNEPAVVAYLATVSSTPDDAACDAGKLGCCSEEREIATLHQPLVHWIRQIIPRSKVWLILAIVIILIYAFTR